MPGYEVRVVDPETGADCPAGTPGELYVRGYAQMQGYYNKPAETAATVTPDGWIKTGDMAVLRADGHIRFLGRFKDMLKIGGENVSPAEVEAHLQALAGVRDAAVVGIADDRLSEIPVAFIALAPESGLDEAAVIQSLEGRIASFKIPRRVFFLAELPATPSGKVRKAALREQARARMAAET